MEQPTQEVLLEYQPSFCLLFGKILLRCKTNAFCIKIEHIVHLFKVPIFIFLVILIKLIHMTAIKIFHDIIKVYF